MRLVPKKPHVSRSVKSFEAPDLEMIGPSGEKMNDERQKLPLL
jgi:hypothetical protein